MEGGRGCPRLGLEEAAGREREEGPRSVTLAEGLGDWAVFAFQQENLN